MKSHIRDKPENNWLVIQLERDIIQNKFTENPIRHIEHLQLLDFPRDQVQGCGTKPYNCDHNNKEGLQGVPII